MATALASGLSVLALAGCDGADDEGDGSGSSAARNAKVDIAGFRFVPEEVRVRVGSRVTWTNRDKAAHTATVDEGQPLTFDTGRLDQGRAQVETFVRPGSYTYFCTYHRFMTATIEVVER
ncbi:MAG TPA: plastocyanin/azurin family copper-binding protein [Thermoleophilaceae bacterium]|jgi:plastocyanin